MVNIKLTMLFLVPLLTLTLLTTSLGTLPPQTTDTAAQKIQGSAQFTCYICSTLADPGSNSDRQRLHHRETESKVQRLLFVLERCQNYPHGHVLVSAVKIGREGQHLMYSLKVYLYKNQSQLLKQIRQKCLLMSIDRVCISRGASYISTTAFKL